MELDFFVVVIRNVRIYFKVSLNVFLQYDDFNEYIMRVNKMKILRGADQKTNCCVWSEKENDNNYSWEIIQNLMTHK